MKHLAHDILEAFLTFCTGLTPAAIGAIVGMAWDQGLTWGQRFLQLAVGIVVSFFASRAVAALWALDPFVLDGVKFTLGMIAFKATPRFIAGAAEVAAGLPAALRDRLFPTKGTGK